MVTTRELLAKVKDANGIPSNYRLARYLDVPETTVQRWNTGRNLPDDMMAARLADLAGLDAAEVVASIHAERATDPALRKLWERVARQAKRGAVSAGVILSLLYGFGGGPDGGAIASGALAMVAFAEPLGSVYYVYLVACLAAVLAIFGARRRSWSAHLRDTGFAPA